MWCWIRRRWDVLRIAVFYGPVWFVILHMPEEKYIAIETNCEISAI
jgi:hypothetical protein